MQATLPLYEYASLREFAGDAHGVVFYHSEIQEMKSRDDVERYANPGGGKSRKPPETAVFFVATLSAPISFYEGGDSDAVGVWTWREPLGMNLSGEAMQEAARAPARLLDAVLDFVSLHRESRLALREGRLSGVEESSLDGRADIDAANAEGEAHEEGETSATADGGAPQNPAG